LIQQRERLELPDGDFLDLDWSRSAGISEKVVVLLHGLEGNAQRKYIKGQARELLKAGYDCCAVNFRGCSGEDNRLYRSYNAGATEDLEAVIIHILEQDHYKRIDLVGFSLGGNLLLKYLGEGRDLPPAIQKGVAVSTPLDLEGSLNRLTEAHNWVYRTTFLRRLRQKYKRKMLSHPDKMGPRELSSIRTLIDFDHLYTAKAHGFKDAYDYYRQNSCRQFLPNICHKVLILNAENDTFLSPNCYPVELASRSNIIYLESPDFGGHVGYVRPGGTYYSETRTREFLLA
jgi:predicted alpha/beta-fold hydrolase